MTKWSESDTKAMKTRHMLWRKRMQRTIEGGLYSSPLVKELFEIQLDHNMKTETLCRLSGVAHSALIGWRQGKSPRITHIEAVLNALGYKLKITSDLEDAA